MARFADVEHARPNVSFSTPAAPKRAVCSRPILKIRLTCLKPMLRRPGWATSCGHSASRPSSVIGKRAKRGKKMALIRCAECAREISDKATVCPNCGAPVDASTALAAPDSVRYSDGQFTGTSAMLTELAKTAVGRLGYRVDSADASAGTLNFTTGMTMGSFSGVSATIAWREVAPYRFTVTGQGKQNVAGGQVMALNLFDEANGKVQKAIEEMQRLASGGSEDAVVTDDSSAMVAGLVIVCVVIIAVVALASAG